MEKVVKIILFPTEQKSKNGKFFESLMESVFQTQGYKITGNVNFTGMEIDLLGKHLHREEILYVECKAKEKPRSSEIKNFIFNISHKKADYGYFIYTEELDHQAAGLKDEIEGDRNKYKNVTFFGPEKVIQALIDSRNIKDINSLSFKPSEKIFKVILAYTYFGIYYVILPSDGTKLNRFYLFNATSLESVDNEETIEINGAHGITIVSELQNSIAEIKSLKLDIYTTNEVIDGSTKIEIIREYITDVPPNITRWVGRAKELNNISSENFKVIFITGLGGQGKSSLASYYVQKMVNLSNYEFWDWRDCKEEENRLHTKIISAIGRITKGNISTSKLSDLKTEDLIDTFFHYLSDRSIVFVFDNIDHYIDLEKFMPIGGIGKLFIEAIEREHKSKFIFTCRPFIRYAAVDFYQIKLEGISLTETTELFRSYNIPIRKETLSNLIQNAHTLTQGHPLWLNLIAAQAAMGADKVKELMDNIEVKDILNESNITSILSEKILGVVWNTLNSKQKLFLRTMSEAVRAESESNIEMFLKSELNYNQFRKSLNQLINLNLIVVKSSLGKQDLLELHPLVKAFIQHTFPKVERNKFISFIEQHYDKIIFILKPKLAEHLPLSSYEMWTNKIELEINKGDYKSALVILNEIHDSIIKAGFVEEYLRVAGLLFSNMNWDVARAEEYNYFNSQLYDYITLLVHFGKNELVQINLTKYEKCISGKSNDFINLSSLRCYYHWFIEEFSEAIKWGEKGEYLLKSANIDKDYDLVHHLALARRDSRDKKNIDISLKYFIGDKNLNEILLSPIDRERSGSYYGNIGRCLHFVERYDDAVNLYKKSLSQLLIEKSSNTVLNIGYACKWIAEILIKKNEFKAALYFIKFGMLSWFKYAPPYANKLNDLFLSVPLEVEEKNKLNALEDWQIEKYCKDWIKI